MPDQNSTERDTNLDYDSLQKLAKEHDIKLSKHILPSSTQNELQKEHQKILYEIDDNETQSQFDQLFFFALMFINIF